MAAAVIGREQENPVVERGERAWARNPGNIWGHRGSGPAVDRPELRADRSAGRGDAVADEVDGVADGGEISRDIKASAGRGQGNGAARCPVARPDLAELPVEKS